MVIACPSCNRKYQIDTTRIPAGGTSFSCWTCRTPVRVVPTGALPEAPSAPPPSAEPRPSTPGAPLQTMSGSSIPPSALRFFESLAAEASLKRQMPSPEAPPAPAERPAAAAPAPAAEPRVPAATLESLHGNNVLDLPEVSLAEKPPAPDIIDVGIDAPPTLALASPPSPAPPTGTAEMASAPAPPIPFPPPGSNEPSAEPQPPVAAPPHPAGRPTSAFAMTSTASMTAGTATLAEPAPPAEISLPPRAWVAPEVDAAPAPRRRRTGVFVFATLVVVALALAVAWMMLRPGRPAPSGPRIAEAPPTRPAAPPSEGQTPAATPVAPATPQEASSAVTAGAPSYTIQLRSSPDESDSRAFVDTLKTAGYDAYVARADLGSRGTWYRVRVGRFESRDEAQRQLAKLRGEGRARDAIVVLYEER